MKRAFLLFLFFCSCVVSYASHIVGGEMYYVYIGPGSTANTLKYHFVLKLFRDQKCELEPQGCAEMPPNVFIGIFDNETGAQFPSTNQPYHVNKSNEEEVPVNKLPSCLVGAPDLDYHVGYYEFTQDLPINAYGYTAAYQTCCRVNPLKNVFNSTGAGGTGSTYACRIPPANDNSAIFKTGIDLLCSNHSFTLDFSATDKDLDSLVYSFCPAYNGGATTDANNINPAAPSYGSVKYINGYTFNLPLGNSASINSKTGIVSGIAPGNGKYIVAVKVQSYKNGILIAEHRKDFIVNVSSCDFAGVRLDPQPASCHGFDVSFQNGNTSSLNKTFYWNFGDVKSGAANISTLEKPDHLYSDTGVFVYKLIVNKGEACADSTTQTIKVYPGFSTGFLSQGQCKNMPVQFIDTSKSTYGIVNSWAWDFNDLQSDRNISVEKDPKHTFTASNDYNVRLISGSSKGCVDTAFSIVSIKDKPDFKISNDTLICVIDTLQLKAVGNGSIFWTPDYSINNQNSLMPLVSPDIPTTYYATFSDAYGCTGTDSVLVDVKKFVTLNIGNDTTICLTDPIIFNTISDALNYKWTPSSTLNNDSIKFPTATPTDNTTYSVTASIGKCNASDKINIKTVPYPKVTVSNDSTICLGSSIQLHAAGGSIYSWSPPFYLDNPDIPDPIASPDRDIRYKVTVKDVLGCPKPVSDSLLIIVQKIVADSGPRDTSVVAGQPLLLKGTGGENFLWTPSTGLSNSISANPVAVLTDDQQYVLKVSSKVGCFDIDTIDIKVYKVAPDLFVPNAFTPGSDGINDVFRPIPIGMKSLTYFKVYSRWGQLMFSSNEILKGWDGSFKGQPQDAGVYVWIAQGIDYLGKIITKKGSVVLIR